ncbi:MAG: peptide chain release factor 2, partial [Actinomycetota bacterium]
MNIEKLGSEIAELEERASAPDLWDDQANAQAVTSRLSFLQAELSKLKVLRSRLDDVTVLLDLAEAEHDA